MSWEKVKTEDNQYWSFSIEFLEVLLDIPMFKKIREI